MEIKYKCLFFIDLIKKDERYYKNLSLTVYVIDFLIKMSHESSHTNIY